MLLTLAALQRPRRTQGMAYGQGQRVGGVGGRRHLGKVQDTRHHAFHLHLLRLPVAGDGQFRLGRGVKRHGDAALRGGEHGKAGRLRGTEHGVAVGLGEHTFDGHGIGCEAVHFLGQAVIDGQKTQILGDVRRGPHHVHMNKRKPAVLAGFDHADPAACKPGVDAKDNHEDYSSSSWAITSSEAVQLE